MELVTPTSYSEWVLSGGMTTSLVLAQMHGTHSSVMQSESLPCAEKTGLKWGKLKMEWYNTHVYSVSLVSNMNTLLTFV